METVNVTFTQDQLGEIFYALRERHNALIDSLKNRNRSGTLIRIEERQLARVIDAMRTTEETISVNFRTL